MNLKPFLLLILPVFFISALQAQSINFFKGTLSEARNEAKKQHKLIYILAEMQSGDLPVLKVQNDPALVKQYNSDFICLYRNFPGGKADENVYLRFNVKSYPTHLFLDEEGGLILKTIGRRSIAMPYMADLNKARELARTKTLTKYRLEYEGGNRDLKFLKEYLLKYDELDLPVDQKPLKTYVDLLPISALDDYQTILFIMERGPVISDKPYKIARANTKLIDSIYKALPYDRRVKMNNRIISSSMVEAKNKRDENIAVQTANFAASTWNNNWQAANGVRHARLMDYYRSVNDTVKYLANAFGYYQDYYQRLRDSIYQPEPLDVQPIRHIPEPARLKTGSATKGVGYTVTYSRPGPLVGKVDPKMAQRNKALQFATTLNNGAYSFYTMRSANPAHLSRAVTWVKRSIELFPDVPGFYDTLSHLYYQQKKYDDAIAAQQKGITILRELAGKTIVPAPDIPTLSSTSPERSKKEIERYTAELEKMKARTL
jgi:tetratricopeptide (TPR) repeat protein